MSAITRSVNLSLNCDVSYQVIDGWGVNINSKYWNEGRLIPVMDMLIDDLGCTIFRLDAWGKSNWIDPENRYDKSILTKETYEEVYAHRDFTSAAGMGKYLNEKGIEREHYRFVNGFEDV
jgi:hypothetical protein